MSNELKDCPFCGREPEQSERADNNTSTGRAYFIACMCGGYSANAHQFGETKEQVTRKWNCRPIAPVASAAPSGERIVKAHAVLQQFKTDWMKVPYFADRVNKATREAISMAIAPIVNLDAVGCPLDVSAIAHQPPKEDLTDEEINLIAIDFFGAITDRTQLKFARAIEAASAPNKQLVAALKEACDLIRLEVADGMHTEEYRRGCAALAAAGEVQS